MIKQDDITLVTQPANSHTLHPFSAGRSPLLQVESLSKSYSDVQVHHDILLQINPGEIISLVGLNGAGKTTLMETLQGGHPFAKGLIRVCGEDIRQGLSQGVKQQLGVAPQFFQFAVAPARGSAAKNPLFPSFWRPKTATGWFSGRRFPRRRTA